MGTIDFYSNVCDDLDVKAKSNMWKICYDFLLKVVTGSVKYEIGDKILDIGCGTGRISNFLPDYTHYTGIDISSGVIKVAKKRYSKGNFFVSSATDLSIFKDKQFDTILCSEVMEHLDFEEWDLVLKEMKRVCKKNGKIIFSMPNFYYLWAYIPYCFFPIKTRLTLKNFLKGFKDGVAYEEYITSEGVKVPFHRRIKPSLLKKKVASFFKVDSVKTTYWYNNQPIHGIFENFQIKILKFSMKTSYIFGSQIIMVCTNA